MNSTNPIFWLFLAANKTAKSLFVGRRAALNKSSDLSSRLQPKAGASTQRVRLNRSNFLGNKPAPRGRSRRVNRNSLPNNSRGNSVRSNIQRGRGRIRTRNISNRGLKQGNYKTQRNNQNSGPRRALTGRGGRQIDSRRGSRGGSRGARGGRGSFRGGRGNRGRGGQNQNFNQGDNRYRRSKQRFQARWQKRRANVDKNKLDKDLDSYMAKTRNQLDADLDAYMAGA